MTQSTTAVALAAALLSSPLAAATQAPIIDMTSVLNTRFYPNGGVLFEDADLVFAPTPPVSATVEILDASQKLLQSFDFFPEYRFRDQAFGRLQANGHAQWQAPGAGEFVIQYRVGGEVVTRFPFRVRTQGPTDAFATNTTVAYEGPWSRLGYIAMRPYRDTTLPDLHYWVGGNDLAAGQSRDQSSARLFRGGALIGHSKIANGHITQGHYVQATHALFAPHEARRAHEAPPITQADLAVDGRYELTIERQSDASVIRRFRFEVRGGSIVQHPRAALDYQPRSELLSPRVYRKGGNYAFQPVIWLSTG
jgi:hypothetical protein